MAVAYRTLGIIINDQCGLRCRHCSLGYSKDYRGTAWKMDESELRRVILATDGRVYGIILMAGGEPSLVPQLLRVGIETCREKGILSAIVTAPIWAATARAAANFLASIGSLDILMLSYDLFHLEFMSVDHYSCAIKEAHERAMRVFLNVCYSNRREKEILMEKVDHLRELIDHIHFQPVLPLGNAANLEIEGSTIDTLDDLLTLEKSCVAGNALLNRDGALYACCWSAKAHDSPLGYPHAPELGFGLSSFVMEQDPTFQSVRNNGLIGSLSTEALSAVVELVRGKRFVNECDLCVHLMRELDSSTWRSFVRINFERKADSPI